MTIRTRAVHRRAATLVALVVVLALAPACRKAAPDVPTMSSSGPRADPRIAMTGGAGGGAGPNFGTAIVGGRAPQAFAVQSPAPPAPRAPSDPVSHLAYAYAMSLELPGERLIEVLDAHLAACRTAGAQVCQLIDTRRQGDPARRLHAEVELRAEPQWLQRFMQGVSRDVAGADGRVTSQSMSAEDLTREIVDTEAVLRAKRALRDRLQQLLTTRPGSLNDLLGVERELARVQGEIDSTESNLTAMRTRVAMSRLALSYTSSPRAVAGSTFEPLGEALAGFVAALVESTAALVTALGALLPWLAALVLVVWLLVAWRRRRARRRAARGSAPSTYGRTPDTP